jgi:large subunit ribosomal protein L6
MSRIGKQPITLPDGVSLELVGQKAKVTGPQGTLELAMPPGAKVEVEEKTVTVRPGRHPQAGATYGLARTLIANMVKGVSEGFNKSLEINGVGYRAAVAGNNVTLQLGFSHPIEFPLPEGISAKIEKNVLTISGADKYLVGQVAADIRSLRKPEPYKGKGIRYTDEHVRRKAGKTAVKGA